MKLIQLAALALSIQALSASEPLVLTAELTVQQGAQSIKLAQELAFQSKTLKEAYTTNPSEPIPVPEFINMQEIIKIMTAFQKNDQILPNAQLKAVALDRSLANYTVPELLDLLKACDYLNFRNGIRLIAHCLAERIINGEPFSKASITMRLKELRADMEEHLFAIVKQYVICLCALSYVPTYSNSNSLLYLAAKKTCSVANLFQTMEMFAPFNNFLIDEKVTISANIIMDCDKTLADDLVYGLIEITKPQGSDLAPYRLYLKRSDFRSSFYHAFTRLDLEKCGLNRLKKRQFLYLPNLVTLDLSNNPLKSLTEGIFESQVKLARLDLREIQLTQIERDTFKGLSALTCLNLHYNTITKLQAGCFIHLKKLKFLSLLGNPLDEIEEGVFRDMPELEKLHLDANVRQKFIDQIQKEAPKVQLDSPIYYPPQQQQAQLIGAPPGCSIQ